MSLEYECPDDTKNDSDSECEECRDLLYGKEQHYHYRDYMQEAYIECR